MPIAYPYSFTCWYGYDQDYASTTSFSSSAVSNFSGVCLAIANQTYYHNGSNTLPVANDTVYSNSAGTTTLSAGYYRLDPLGADKFMIVGTGGNVTSVSDCSGGGGGPP